MAAGGFISAPSAPFPKQYDVATIISYMVLARLDELKMDRKSAHIAQFVNVVMVNTFDCIVLQHTDLGKFLIKYGSKIRAEPEYNTIQQIFLEKVACPGEHELNTRYTLKNYLHTYFLPRSKRAIHDDHIMMIILMAVEVIVEALKLQKIQLARGFLIASNTFLCPSTTPGKEVFSVSNWLFRDWLQNSQRILDPTRRPNIIIDMDLLGRPIPVRTEDAIGLMIPYVYSRENEWRTAFASNASPEEQLSPDKSLLEPLRSVLHKDILHSFLCDRLDRRIPEAIRQSFREQRKAKHTYRMLGRLMNMTADRIASLPNYQELENNLIADYHAHEGFPQNVMAFMAGLNNMVLDRDGFFTFEQVVASFLLLSRCNNEILLNKEMNDAQELFAGACRFVSARRTLKNLWNRYTDDPDKKIKKILTEPLVFLKTVQGSRAAVPAQRNAPPSARSETISQPRSPASSAIQRPVEPVAATQAAPRPQEKGQRDSAQASTKIRPPKAPTFQGFVAPPTMQPPGALPQRPIPASAVPQTMQLPATIPRRPIPPPAATQARPATAPVLRSEYLTAVKKARLIPAAPDLRSTLSPAAKQSTFVATAPGLESALPPVVRQARPPATMSFRRSQLPPAGTYAQLPTAAPGQSLTSSSAATKSMSPSHSTDPIQALDEELRALRAAPTTTETAEKLVLQPTAEQAMSPGFQEAVFEFSDKVPSSSEFDLGLENDPTLGEPTAGQAGLVATAPNLGLVLPPADTHAKLPTTGLVQNLTSSSAATKPISPTQLADPLEKFDGDLLAMLGEAPTTTETAQMPVSQPISPSFQEAVIGFSDIWPSSCDFDFALENDPTLARPTAGQISPSATLSFQRSPLSPAGTYAELPTTAQVQGPTSSPAATKAMSPRHFIDPSEALDEQLRALLREPPTTSETAQSSALQPTAKQALSPGFLEAVIGVSEEAPLNRDFTLELPDDPTLEDSHEQFFEILREEGIEFDLTENPEEYGDLLLDDDKSDRPLKKRRFE